MISATSSSIERVPSTRVTRQLNVCSHARSPCHRRQSDARDHRPADDQAVGAAIAAALSLSLSRVLLLCAIGSYTVANSPVAVLLAALFSVLGYAFKRLEPRLPAGAADGGQRATGHARIEWRSDVVSRTAFGGHDGCATRTDRAAGDPCRPRRRVSEGWLRPR
jgi:hypothetical protein